MRRNAKLLFMTALALFGALAGSASRNPAFAYGACGGSIQPTCSMTQTCTSWYVCTTGFPPYYQQCCSSYETRYTYFEN
jgi:hypothetical protein